MLAPHQGRARVFKAGKCEYQVLNLVPDSYMPNTKARYDSYYLIVFISFIMQDWYGRTIHFGYLIYWRFIVQLCEIRSILLLSMKLLLSWQALLWSAQGFEPAKNLGVVAEKPQPWHD